MPQDMKFEEVHELQGVPACRRMVSAKAKIVLRALEREERRLKKALKRNREAQMHIATIVGLASDL